MAKGKRRKRRRKEDMHISYPATSKHILVMGKAYHLSYTASSNLHERILEYLTMEYLY